jgi:peptidoglycan/xylan/chitin deacetylase (PgdA/CDA1 family)
MQSIEQRVRGAIRTSLEFCVIELMARLLYYTGVLYLIGFVRQRIGRRRLLIPMYHRISKMPKDDSAKLLAIQQGVSQDLFREHVRIFRWFGPLLRLDAAFDQLHDSTCSSRTAIALTFDDGYRDTVTLAWPVLRAIGASATIFPVVRTASAGRALWWDELSDIVWRGAINGGGYRPIFAKLDGIELPQSALARCGADAASRAVIAQLVCERLKDLPATRRESVLDELATRLGIDDTRRRSDRVYATWDELRSVAAAGCEIGGHTLGHPVLTCEDRSTVQAEVFGCRAELQQRLGTAVLSFAYPNGRHDTTVRSVTAAAGYRCAVTVQHGVNYAETDPYQLRRVPVFRERPFHLAFKLAFYGCVRRG